jgi:hypothetical protein
MFEDESGASSCNRQVNPVYNPLRGLVRIRFSDEFFSPRVISASGNR